MTDHYEVLGVSRDADAATIKQAYRKLRSIHHSDREGGDDEKMAEINVAYEVLSDAARRVNYDATGSDRILANKAAAEQAVLSLMMNYLQDLAREDDMMAWIVQNLVGQRAQILQTNKRAEDVIAHLRKKLTRVKYKGAGKNQFADLVTQQIAVLEKQIRDSEDAIKRIEMSIEFARDYEYLVAQPFSSIMPTVFLVRKI